MSGIIGAAFTHHSVPGSEELRCVHLLLLLLQTNPAGLIIPADGGLEATAQKMTRSGLLEQMVDEDLRFLITDGGRKLLATWWNGGIENLRWQ